MFPELGILKQPIAIRPEHIADSQKTFLVQQQGHGGSKEPRTKFTIEATNSAKPLREKDVIEGKKQHEMLITVDARYLTLEDRHAFRDATGLPLFELYHNKSWVTWYIDTPGGNGTKIAVIKPRLSLFKDVLDVQLKNAAADGEDVTLHVRGQDVWKQRINVYFGDSVVMTVKRTDKLSAYVFSKKLSWVVDVAEGMDVSLASAIVVVLAATLYTGSMTFTTKK